VPCNGLLETSLPFPGRLPGQSIGAVRDTPVSKRNQMFCRLCKVVVERADLVRRFEVSKGKYVQVTEEELQSVEVEANNGIEFRELSRSLLREQLLSGTVNKVPRSRQSAFSLGTIPRLQSLHVDDLMTAPLDR